MRTQNQHFKEEIQDLVDNRITPALRATVEKHLESCEQCRREFEALSFAKQLSNKRYVTESITANLEENILAALDLEDRQSSRSAEVSGAPWRKRRVILAYALLLVVAVTLVAIYFILGNRLRGSPELSSTPQLPTKLESPSTQKESTKLESPVRPEPSPKPELSLKTESPTKLKLPTKTKQSAKPKSSLRSDLSLEVARDYRKYKAGKIPLTLKTEDVNEMEKLFSAEAIPFKTRVFDLGMMSFRLLGGRAHRLNFQKSAFFVYRGKGDSILVCQMYHGGISELPAGAVRRENKGTTFYIYRVKDVTAVFWQEGTVTCVLASDIDPEQLVQLAFAKAVKV